MRRLPQVLLLFTFLIQTIVITQNTPTVIELFTSQGCSSCPPADALLEEINDTYGDNVITLSYHVDYWDYIGWKDPFATRQFTQKQYTYAERFRSRSVYTPQAVINGRTHYTGSDKRAIYNVLNSKSTIAKPINLEISNTAQQQGTIVVDYNIANTTTADELTFVVTINEKVTQVKRGENRNRTLKNTHIVVAEQSVQRYAANGKILLQLPDWIKDNDQLSVVAYATQSNVGIIDAVTTTL